MPSCRPSRLAPSSPIRWLDGLSLCASSLCTIHCLALPLLFAILPALASRIDPGESFHLWMLALAVPTSLIALTQGWRRHRRIALPLLGLIGLGAMALGALATTSAAAGTTWTLIGSMMLATAHIANWRSTRAPQSL